MSDQFIWEREQQLKTGGQQVVLVLSHTYQHLGKWEQIDQGESQIWSVDDGGTGSVSHITYLLHKLPEEYKAGLFVGHICFHGNHIPAHCTISTDIL